MAYHWHNFKLLLEYHYHFNPLLEWLIYYLDYNFPLAEVNSENLDHHHYGNYENKYPHSSPGAALLPSAEYSDQLGDD